MQAKTISITLKKAKEWYVKGGDLKELALSAFTMEDLENATDIEWDYNDLLNKFAEKYQIGNVVWSNDSTDYYPHVIISKPYLTPMHSGYGLKYGICFRTMRILPLDGEVFNSKILACYERDFVGLTIHGYFKRGEFVYKDWKRDIIARYKEEIKYKRNNIDAYKEKIEMLNKETEQREHVTEHFDEIYKNLYEKAMLSSEI